MSRFRFFFFAHFFILFASQFIFVYVLMSVGMFSINLCFFFIIIFRRSFHRCNRMFFFVFLFSLKICGCFPVIKNNFSVHGAVAKKKHTQNIHHKECVHSIDDESLFSFIFHENDERQLEDGSRRTHLKIQIKTFYLKIFLLFHIFL